jgi:hypothetical protein
MSDASKRDDPLGRILSYLVAITTIIGIPAGLYGYYSNQHDKRVEKTFEFYRTFRADSLQKDWSLLVGRWNAKAQEAQTLVRQGNQPAFEKFVILLVDDKEGAPAMEHVLSFFDELTACVSNSLCDQNTAYALFEEPARQFAGAYGTYVLHIRQQFNNGQYGSGLFQSRSLRKTISFF